MELLTVVLLLSSLAAVYFWFRPKSRLPPCPTTPLPIVGHLLTVKKDPRIQFRKWHEKCGDIFSLYMGRKLYVVLGGYDLLKETFVKRPAEFSDRADLMLDKVLGLPGCGIFLTSGSTWKEQRSVTLSILRSFGLGKNTLAETIQEEGRCYLQALENLQGEPTDLREITNISTANIICSLVLGNRFEYEDEVFKDFLKKIRVVMIDLNLNDLVNFFPFLGYLPWDISNTKKINACMQEIRNFVTNKFIKLKRQEQEKYQNVNNFVTAYDLHKENKLKANEPTSMNDDHLIKIILELFLAGMDSTGTVLLWSLLFALNYPDVQDKIRQEIEEQIGSERSPVLQDKPKLIYLNAFIMEVLRCCDISALGFPYQCNQETSIRGYILPKGTVLIPHLASVLHDPKIWGEDEDVFRPERFIDEDGKLKSSEEFIPFGIGRRLCIGEGLAKSVMFLHLSSIFQRFKIVSPDPKCPPKVEGIFGLDFAPVPFKVRVLDLRTIA